MQVSLRMKRRNIWGISKDKKNIDYLLRTMWSISIWIQMLAASLNEILVALISFFDNYFIYSAQYKHPSFQLPTIKPKCDIHHLQQFLSTQEQQKSQHHSFLSGITRKSMPSCAAHNNQVKMWGHQLVYESFEGRIRKIISLYQSLSSEGRHCNYSKQSLQHIYFTSCLGKYVYWLVPSIESWDVCKLFVQK